MLFQLEPRVQTTMQLASAILRWFGLSCPQSQTVEGALDEKTQRICLRAAGGADLSGGVAGAEGHQAHGGGGNIAHLLPKRRIRCCRCFWRWLAF